MDVIAAELIKALVGAGRWRNVLVVLLVLGLIAFELATGTVYYSIMERRVALLNELRQLSQSGVAADSQLGPVYQDLVTQLNAGSTFAYRPISVVKFLAGGFLGIVILILQLRSIVSGSTREPHSWAGLLVGLFFTVILGLIGAFLPDFGAPWVNAIAYIVVLFVLSVLGGLAVANRRGATGPWWSRARSADRP